MLAGVIDDVLRCDDPFGAAAALGLDGVEVALGTDDLRSPFRLALLAEARRRSGLAIPTLILAGHVADGGVADADPDAAARAAGEVEQAVAWASELHANAVLVPFFLASDLPDAASVDRCAAAFARLCPVAERAGVTLCFEGSLAAPAVLGLAERAGSPAFGVTFDLANPIVAGLDPPQEARALAPLIRRVHVKDTRERRGDCRPGEGRVDFAACAGALDEIGYDGWLVLETPPGPPEAVARDLAFTRAAFPALRRRPGGPRPRPSGTPPG